MRTYNIDPDQVWPNSYKVFINIGLLQAASGLLMMVQFGNMFGSLFTSKRSSQPKNIPPKPVERKKSYESRPSIISILKPNIRHKSRDETQFNNYCRGRILLSWQNLSLYASDSKFFERRTSSEKHKDERLILQQLNGHCSYGTLNALMGTSGAGKTSLLKVLNGQYKTRLGEGTTFGVSKYTRLTTCFITQDVSGHLMPGLTAKQLLVYTSQLKNGPLRSLPDDSDEPVRYEDIDHESVALNLLAELNLIDTADTLVEKCSGGERKRLALALELTSVHMPNLVCIDEPTSGLDSNSAEIVLSCLRTMTLAHNITIVASIHQPNSRSLFMFNQIYVLARGGVCVYQGSPEGIAEHLNQALPDEELDKAALANHDVQPIEVLIKYSCNQYPNSKSVQCLMNVAQDKFRQHLIESGRLEEETQATHDGVQRNRRRFSLYDVAILARRYVVFSVQHLWMIIVALISFEMAYGVVTKMLFDTETIKHPSGCISLDEDDFNGTCTKTQTQITDENNLKRNIQFVGNGFGLVLYFIVLQTALVFSINLKLVTNEKRNGK